MAVNAARAKSLFLNASDVADPAERAAYLDRECGGDAELRARVEALLRANDAASAEGGVPATAGDACGARIPDPLPRTEDYGDPTARVGAVLAGKYKLVEEIGEGGMGSVFMAQQTEPVKRAVAVKVIKAGMDSRAVLARFEAERQALAMMDHPNIAKVLDAGTTDGGRPFFVMELVKGKPITRFCDDRRLTPRQRLELFVPVCQAIQHAHQKGIIHRDLKPSNVLVALYDDRPVPKIIDFGVAKAAGQALTDKTLMTGFGALVGTPEYMSPEQANLNNLDIDTRSDVYSLGVLLYELLTGTTPVDRKRLGKAAILEILRIVREVEAPKPSAKLSTIDTLPSVAANRGTEPTKLSKLMKGELDWVVLKALEKDRARRYDTAIALARDIERYLDDEVVEARPPSARYRFQKFVRRHRPQVIAAGLIVLALVAGMAGTTFAMVEARRQEAEAKKQEGLAREEALAKEQARASEAAQRQAAEKAATAEKAAKEQTQKRLNQIEKGVELFAGMLQGINPRSEEKEGKPLYEQLRERAEKAADQLQAEAVADPLAEARLQTLLGDTLRELGSYDMAIAVLERARATRLRELAADAPDTLQILNNLGVAYLEAGQVLEAIPLLEQVRDVRVKNLGPNHLDTLHIVNNLASAYHAAGRRAEAMALYERVRDVRLMELGADHIDTLTTLNNLADVYRAVGRSADAIALFEQVLDAFSNSLGADHSTYLTTLSNLGEAYLFSDRAADAIPLLEKAWDALVKKLGADHPNTLATLNNLANAYRDAGRIVDAIPLFEQARDVQVKKLGVDHPNTLAALNNLAAAYWSLKQLDRSIPLFEEVLDRRKKKMGRQHPDTLVTVANLGVNYLDAGRLAEAMPLLEEAKQAAKTQPDLRWVGSGLLEAYVMAGQTLDAARLIDELLADDRKALPEGSPQLAGELAQFGSALLETKGFANAEPLLRECLAIRQQTLTDDWRTFNTQSMLGGALLGQKKYAEAEPLLLAGYEGLKQREETIPPQGASRLYEALDRLIELYTATNKPDEVRQWQAERAKYPDGNTKPPEN
jgi:serine/threonine protein kinase